MRFVRHRQKATKGSQFATSGDLKSVNKKKVTIWTLEFVGNWLFGVRKWLNPEMKKPRKTLILRGLAEFCPDLSG